MIFSAVLTTLCRDFQSEVLQAPNQTHAAVYQTLGGASLEGGQDGRRERSSQEVRVLLCLFCQGGGLVYW